MAKAKAGQFYVRNVANLLATGAEVALKKTKIAGIPCKEYTIGNKYRLLRSSNCNRKAVLFEKVSNNWEQTSAPSITCVFLYSLIEYRKQVFNLNEQEGTTNNSLG